MLECGPVCNVRAYNGVLLESYVSCYGTFCLIVPTSQIQLDCKACQ